MRERLEQAAVALLFIVAVAALVVMAVAGLSQDGWPPVPW